MKRPVSPVVMAALAAAVVAAPAAAQVGFPQSVASGDPTPQSVVLWTRVVPDDPTGMPRSLDLEVAADSAFVTVVASRTVDVDPEHDGVAKVRVDGLQPYTTYWYRFSFGGVTSPVGRTRTAPAPTEVQPLRFAVVYCQDYVGRYYNALAHLANTYDDDVDLVVHLGDYVYETTGDPSFQNPDSPRRIEFAEPDGAIDLGNDNLAAASLSNYRDLYRTYRDDPVLQEVHERWPMVTTWDDHEYSNDAWGATATYFNGRVDETDPDRKRAAEQAFFEWAPTSVGIEADGTFDLGPQDLWPNTSFSQELMLGSLLHLVLPDGRTFRPDHLIPEDAFPGAVAVDEPTLRLILGDAGFDALSSGFDPYVDMQALGLGLPILRQTATLATAVAIQTERPELDTFTAVSLAKDLLAGPVSTTFLNLLWQAQGFEPVFTPDLTAGLPRGVAFWMMGKQSFYSSLGSRNFVVNPTFQLFAAKRALETGGAAQDVLGPQQNAWLAGVLSQSPAAWKVVGNSVMMTPTMVDFTNPLIAANLPDGFPDQLRTAVNLNNEDFSGFPNYRDALLDDLFAVVPGEVVLVSGDIHAAFVADHRNGVYEFTPPAVSSGTFGELAVRLAQTDPLLSQIPGVVDLLEGFLGQFFQVSSTSQQYSRTDIAYAETFTHGYGVFEVTDEVLTVTFYEMPSSETGTDYTDDPTALDALFTATTFRVQNGQLVPVP